MGYHLLRILVKLLFVQYIVAGNLDDLIDKFNKNEVIPNQMLTNENENENPADGEIQNDSGYSGKVISSYSSNKEIPEGGGYKKTVYSTKNTGDGGYNGSSSSYSKTISRSYSSDTSGVGGQSVGYGSGGVPSGYSQNSNYIPYGNSGKSAYGSGTSGSSNYIPYGSSGSKNYGSATNYIPNIGFNSTGYSSGGYGSGNYIPYSSSNSSAYGSGGYGSSNYIPYGSSNSNAYGSNGYGSSNSNAYGSGSKAPSNYIPYGSLGSKKVGGYGSGSVTYGSAEFDIRVTKIPLSFGGNEPTAGPNNNSGGASVEFKSKEIQSEKKVCTKKPTVVPNASVKCTLLTNTCKAKCNTDYQFPNGETVLNIVCEDGEWALEKSEWNKNVGCEPICMPPCKNNGICIQPGQCACPENFVGPYCEHEKRLCLTPPALPKNSKRICDSKSCTITCANGHRFPDGTSIINLICKDGEWAPSRSDLVTVPDCQPVCTPECQNGGICLSYNICQCPQDFRGPQCQYSVDVCSPLQLKFNGAYSCSGDSECFKCKLSCPQGIEFESPSASEYVCLYANGYFLPSPIPQCKFESDVEVVSGGHSKSSFSNMTLHQSVSGSSGGVKRKNTHKTSKGKLKYNKYAIDGDDDESYEKKIIKTKVIIQKGRGKNRKGYYVSGDDEDEEEEEDENDGEETEEESSGMHTIRMIGVRKLYVTNTINVMHRVPKSATCVTWNGRKVKTFDGLVYSHDLYCSHMLLQDRVDGAFSIIVRACPYGSKAFCSHALDIILQATKYSVENKNGTIKLSSNDKVIAIPAQMLGIRVKMVGYNLKINLELIGASITWNLGQMVIIEVSAGLWNRTAGLCGTLDQIAENDFASKDGSVHKLTSTFVDTWKAPSFDRKDDRCESEEPQGDEGLELVCPDDIKFKATSLCNQLLNGGKFGDCLKSMDQESMLETCISDYCYCSHENREKCACDGVSVFAKDCLFQGVKLNSEWRNLEICPLPCENGRVYKACGPSFEKSCGSAEEEVIGNNCNEGCFCPDGTIQHEGKCIRIDDCPCSLRGRAFKPGSEVLKDCNTCKCDKGTWRCTSESCSSRCSAIGDPHYVTFDGTRFDAMGKCSYYLLKRENFSIEAENIACPGSISESMNLATTGFDMPSCTKSITINVQYDDKIKNIKLKQGSQVLVDGLEITKFPLKILDGLLRIRHASSIMTLVAFRDGLKVWWDGMTRVYIDAPPSYRGKTKGLCGTFNSNLQDDFLTPEGDVETSLVSFVNKWRTSEKCDYVSDSVNVPHPCQLNQRNKERAVKFCSKLKNKIFDECHWYVDPDPFYEDCLYDMCACTGDYASCMCPILAAYATECARQGSIIKWRYSVDECSVKCPAGQIFEECADQCYRSCADIESTKPCKTKCVEGCRCPRGQALDDRNECIPVTMCPCIYQGLEFNSGYKEVRPANKYLELCTCSGGQWDCVEAKGDDKEKYPPAADIRSSCLAENNEEFTTCEPAEPKTCKNMHNYHESSTVECRPGCVCKKGYVFDVSRKKCVLPDDCSCHHGSKSYSDGEQIKSDCNTCACKAGTWKCTDRPCPGVCTTWGDSHFETYDSKNFDFQGACSYVLSKGATESGEGFSVTIENILCGTLGVTCSKSVSISITGSEPEVIILSADMAIPGSLTGKKDKGEITTSGPLKKFSIHRAGVFVIVEIPAMGVQLKWDRGTRIYILLRPRWKGRVQGLCGNFNGDALDDLKTPSSGLEVNAALFGNAWKLEDVCPTPSEQIDSCNAHPERKFWAEKKCGVLKSEVFEKCHSEVPVDLFLKRCIFDSCACDQGGDCECLCTAIAAYAHACTAKGVPIKWRTPDFCPMQCDPHCSEYSPCIPSCPLDTCENILDQAKDQRLCNEDTCVEGCKLKPCAAGEIYKNNSYTECVPKAVCRPVCLVIDGKDYYEGDVTKSDNCQTCHCSKGKEVCIGIPCGPTSILPHHGIPKTYQDAQANCTSGWTEWLNQDKLGVNVKSVKANIKTGDLELLPSEFVLKNLNQTVFCTREFMKQIECRTVDKRVNPKKTGEDVECSLERGLICVGECHDYEIRVMCDCEDNIELFTVPTLDVLPNVTPSVLKFDPEPVKYIIPPTEEDKCPPGKVWSECAVPCGRACHYYSNYLQTMGLCTNGHNTCLQGCVPQTAAVMCSPSQYWRDDKICVKAADCTCKSEDGRIVKPGAIFKESECKTCQCIDNVYVCDDEQCEKIEKVTVPKESKNVSHSVLIIQSTVTPPAKCEPEKLVSLIEGQHPLPDKAFNASGCLGPSHEPKFARLNSMPSSESSGSWSPEINDQMQYLQIAFSKLVPIFGVIIRGSPIFDQYVTSFKILHSSDGIAFHYLVDETTHPQIFSGPIDSRTPVKSLFKIPIEAKVVRIYPLTWHGSIAIRLELLGCTEDEEKKNITVPHIEEEEIVRICDDSLGVTDGKMHPNQINFSSSKDIDNAESCHKIKLTSKNGWRPAIDSPNEYVMFDFLEIRNVTGIKTKGGEYGWVTAYNVLYSKDMVIWNMVLDKDGMPRLFLGNFDCDTVKTNSFKLPINARAMKIVPIKWHDCIELKAELIGCFIPYKIEGIQLKAPSLPSRTLEATNCGICAGVMNGEMPIEGICRCELPLYWNGDECVQKNMCPCIVGHLTYGVGAQYEAEDCSKCMCVMGGTSQCKPQECLPCADGLRRVPSSTCVCACEPCPTDEKLCPTSGACIPLASWCDGVQDCPDDELNCAQAAHLKPTIYEKKIEKVIITKKCPEPVCPPGFTLEIKQLPRKASRFSPMLKTEHKPSGAKTGYKHLKKGSKPEKLRSRIVFPDDSNETSLEDDEDCAEYSCIPIIKPSKNLASKFACPEPANCPIGYKLVIIENKQSMCPHYKCEPLPQNDAVCNFTGRTLNTFDGTEFKYDICNHVLARDFVLQKWSVAIFKNCTFGNYVCQKEVIIKDKECDVVLVLYTDLTLQLDGYKFTVDQLQTSKYAKTKSFVVSKVGNAIVFISHLLGFWVRLDDLGDVKVGVSPKYNGAVDGLCGFFNGDRIDDKRFPNGTKALSSVEFGDAWFADEGAKKHCEPHACPQSIQDTAWEICNKVKDEVFAPCAKALDYDQFISKCLETACECLKTDSTNKDRCKCSLLQSFVTECLANNENILLDTWRAKHDCPSKCVPPFVHKECYRRRCEPSCDNMDCPYLPGVCFSGCYCPEGMVRKGEECIPVSDCKDCNCDGFGKSQYITYDQKNFTIDGNCTYLLTRDLLVPNAHNFQIYVSLGVCDDDHDNAVTPINNNNIIVSHSCAKSLHILYQSHVLLIQKQGIENKVSTIKTKIDSNLVNELPFKTKWMTINEIEGKGINLQFTESNLVVNVMCDELSFSIRLPSIKYGGKLEGLCGDCDGSQGNDLKWNSQNKTQNSNSTVKDIIDSWVADEPALNITQKCVKSEQMKDCVPPPANNDPCLAILDQSIFGKCHLLVDPTMFVSLCHTYLCRTGAVKEVCSHLAAYARECSRNGLCIDWKKGKCKESIDCPADMIYEPCGCQKTCETIKNNQQNKEATKCANKAKDGCFCRPGYVLSNNGKCIPERECTQCGNNHYVGDQWYPDKCTLCECGASGKVNCIKKECSAGGIICQSGYKQEKVEQNDECCPTYKCVPEVINRSTDHCPETPLPSCAEDQFNKIIVDNNNCSKYVCECKPTDQCKPIPIPKLQPGEVIINETSGCCPTRKVICDKSKCPPKPLKCEEQFYELVKNNTVSNACCDRFDCVPPKNLCIVEIDSVKKLKNIDEIWTTKDPCQNKKCAYGPNGQLVTIDEKQICSVTQCPLGFSLKIPAGKCCGDCVQDKCVFDGVLYEADKTWQSNDSCITHKCEQQGKQLVVTTMMPTCPVITDCPPELKYFEDCCERCKIIVEDKKNCLPISLSDKETIGLVEMVQDTHGKCINKEPIRDFTECHGTCDSGTKYNRLTLKQDKKCTCCSIGSYDEISVPVQCADNSTSEIKVNVPKSCHCQPCDENEQHKQQLPQSAFELLKYSTTRRY